jgi:hypothetical protein
MSRRLPRRLFAALLLLPLLAFATATSGVGLRCRITGALLNACCCEQAGAGSPAGDVPTTVSAADCCDRLVRVAPSATAELRAPERLVRSFPARAPLPTVALPGLLLAVDAAPAWARADARAHQGPPTVRLRLLSKSAFLI